MQILILSQNEISHNPRLLKAADYFLLQDWEVTVVNGVTGFGEKKEYERIKKTRKWDVCENIIDKRNRFYYIRWSIISFVQKGLFLLWSRFGLGLGFPYILNKGLLGVKIPAKPYDVVLINLVDTLPLAARIKDRLKCKFLIYDSQEFFEGQYQKYDHSLLQWVIQAESKYIKHADLILGTTNVMVEELSKKFSPIPVIRVRNLPYKSIDIEANRKCERDVLNIVWHGMSINYNNCRGVQVIVKALAKCKTNVQLTLQGKRIEKDYAMIKKEATDLGIWEKIEFRNPAPPDKITESLTNFDIGVTGEIPEEQNQVLTSSNKLFEYIHAGLCTVAPDLPGISETIKKYRTGEIYKTENDVELAYLLDKLNRDRDKLESYKRTSLEIRNELEWPRDYESVKTHILKDISLL